MHPKNVASEILVVSPEQDAIHIKDQVGNIISWVDFTGVLQGGLLPASTNSIGSVPIDPSPPSNSQVLTYSSSSGKWGPSFPVANINKLQGQDVSPAIPAEGQVLQWDALNNYWKPGSGSSGNTYNTRYSTDFNWSLSYDSQWGSLTAGQQSTLILSKCPKGVDTSGSSFLGGPQGAYSIYISGTGTTEAAKITGGTCTSGAVNGTIIFTPFFDHGVGYTLKSATAGIQEAINDGCGTDPSSSTYKNSGCKIIISPSGPAVSVNAAYDLYDTIYFHANESVLSGYGSILNCRGRGPCLQVGNLKNSNNYANSRVEGITFRPPVNLTSDPAFGGSLITSTQRSLGTVTITTQNPHGFRTGDMICQMFTDDNRFWGDVPSITVIDSTTYTYSREGAADISLKNGPGVAALLYVAVLDNASSTHFVDIQTAVAFVNGSFTHFFDIWDDENCTIERFNNNAHSLTSTVNWSGSYVWSGGARNLPSTTQQLAAVISIKNTNMTANGSNGVTAYNCNGLYVSDTVIQASGLWQIYVSNSTGNFQTAALNNVYTEASFTSNPLSPPLSPFPGCGVSGLISGFSSGASGGVSIRGNGTVGGLIPSYGTGSATYVYYVVAKDVTAGTQTSPMPCMYWQGDGIETPTVYWPRVSNGSNVITYDLIRTIAPSHTVKAANGDFVAPYSNGCPGGAPTTCGSVAVDISQGSGLVQTYVDNTALSTNPYNTIPRGTFAGNIIYWPGDAIVQNIPIFVDNETMTTGVGLAGQPVQIANYCGFFGISTGGLTICIGSKLSTGNSVRNQSATFMQDGPAAGGSISQSKGRLNFIMSKDATTSKHHIITLVDSNPEKTTATTTYRPLADANDTWIGLDNGAIAVSGAQLAMGAPVALSHYIANVGDGTSWLERLTAGKKQFAVPIQLASYTFSTLPGSPVNGFQVYCSDCAILATCAGGGSGAFAKRINNAWVCN